jgi:hypothetical protein
VRNRPCHEPVLRYADAVDATNAVELLTSVNERMFFGASGINIGRLWKSN